MSTNEDTLSDSSPVCDDSKVKDENIDLVEDLALSADEQIIVNDNPVIYDLPLLTNIEDDLKALTLENSSSDPTLVDVDVMKEATSDKAIICNGISYVRYKNETQMPAIMHLITKDLSEPYSIYTYRYFIHNWPHLCYLAIHNSRYVGAIVCKLDIHKKITRRGYIAMLAVDKEVRRKRIGTNLVKLAIGAMQADGCDEVVLETEVTNNSALRLYENLGFVRDKRLFRYYLNGVDALRLKLWMC